MDKPKDNHEPSPAAKRLLHENWIAGRVMTLQHHYYQPEASEVVAEMALEDWIDMLAPFPQEAIQQACRSYMADEPSKRPTPGAIRDRAAKAVKAKMDHEKHLALMAPERAALPAPTQDESEEHRRRMAARAQEIIESMGFSVKPRSMPEREDVREPRPSAVTLKDVPQAEPNERRYGLIDTTPDPTL